MLCFEGAPQLEFLAGRPNTTIQPVDGLVPRAFDTVNSILERFTDAGNFSPAEVVALLAAHSIAHADHIDPTLDSAPFDSVSSAWYMRFLRMLNYAL